MPFWALLAFVWGANPIRKVVNMLNMMSEKVEKGGEREEELFDQYMCYCKTNTAALEKSVAAAQAKIPQLESGIEEDGSAKSQLDEELKQHKTDRAEGNQSLSTAEKGRGKEHAQFQNDSTEAKTNIASLGKAVQAIEAGIEGGALLQTDTGSVVKGMLESSNTVSEDDRDSVTAFLSGRARNSSGEIVGILKQMKEDMEKDLAEMEQQEQEAQQAYEALTAGKRKEVAAATAAIESKMSRVGNLAMQVAEAKDDLEDTTKTLADDQEFLVNLKQGCAEQEKAWAVRQETRQQELTAIAETIKILNDDDALDLFKKTLPSPEVALIQMHSTTRAVQRRALNLLQQLHDAPVAVSLIALSLKSKKVDFSVVVKMIDDLVVVLKKEQTDDDQHKTFCEKEFDRKDDTKKDVQRDIEGFESQKNETKGSIESLAEEVATLKAGIVALDQSVAEATENRKKEHEEFVQTSTDNQTAMDLIAFAKNRLQKFYNPKLYKAPPKQELSEEDKIAQNFGAEVPTPAPAGGIAGTGIGFLQLGKAAPPPPPPAVGGSYQKGEASGGVMAMMDNLLNDLRKEMQEAEHDEKEAQKEYETLAKDAKAKRAADSEAITNKETAKAEAEESLQNTNDSLQESQAALLAVNEAIANLHSSCDFLVENYATRKQARGDEVEALQKAKAVLAGSNFSFAQHGFLQ